MKIIDNLNEFIDAIDNAKKVNPADLSSDQDLTIAIMNLISIEEHLFFSGAKTHDTSFYDLIEPIRENRKILLQKIIKQYKGEVWCISKHLLATCMRLSEVGTKALHDGDKEEAYDLFNRAYDMYCLFWGLNINNVSSDDTKKMIQKIDPKTNENIKNDTEQHPKNDKKKSSENKKDFEDLIKVEKNDVANNNSMMGKLKGFVSKAVDCCRE
jgi:DNA-binding cell septation regulator SpoVG